MRGRRPWLSAAALRGAVVAAGLICAGLSWGAVAASAQPPAFAQVGSFSYRPGCTPVLVTFNPSGGLLASLTGCGNLGGNASVFQVDSGGALSRVSPPGPPVGVDGSCPRPQDNTPSACMDYFSGRSGAFSPSGKFLAVESASIPSVGAGVFMFSVASNGVLTHIGDFATGGPSSSTPSAQSAVAFSPDGTLLAIANWADDTVTVYSVGSDGVLTGREDTGGFTNPWAVAFSPDGELAVVSRDSPGTVSMYQVDRSTNKLNLLDKATTGNDPNSVAFSPNGKLLATANYQGASMSLFSVLPGGNLVHLFDEPTGGRAASVAFSRGGGLLAVATSGFPGNLAVFSVVGDVSLIPVSGSPFEPATMNALGSVAFSPRGLLAVGENNYPYLLDVYRTTGELQIDKTADRKGVAPGEKLTYTITVHNPTSDPMTGSLIDDLRGVLDKATYLHDAHATFGGVVVRTVPRRLLWDGTVPAGETAKITYSVRVHGSAQGELYNSVTGSPGSGCVPDAAAGLPCVTRIPIVETPGSGPDLELTKTASSATVHPGGQVVFTLTVHNHGPGTANGVTVEDPNPAGLFFQAAHTDEGSCTITTELVCHLGSIEPGGGALIQVTATVPTNATGTITNEATVFAPGPHDPHPGNNTASSTVHVIPLPAPAPDPGPQPVSNLVVTKHVNHRTAVRGQRLRYTITVTNKGPDQAAQVSLTDTSRLPVRVLSIHPSQGRCQTGRPITCALGTLAAGKRVTITITAAATTAGTQINAASATSTSWHPDPAASIAIARTTIRTLHIAPRPRPRPRPPAFTG